MNFNTAILCTTDYFIRRNQLLFSQTFNFILDPIVYKTSNFFSIHTKFPSRNCLFPSLQLTLITILHVHYIFTKNFSDNLLSTYSFLSASNINLDTLYMCSAIPSRLNLVDMAVHVQTRVLRIGFFEDPPTDTDGRVIQSEA